MKYRTTILSDREVALHKILAKSATIKDRLSYAIFVVASNRIRKDYNLTREIWNMSRNYHANIVFIPPNQLPIPVYH